MGQCVAGVSGMGIGWWVGFIEMEWGWGGVQFGWWWVGWIGMGFSWVKIVCDMMGWMSEGGEVE